MESKCVFCHEEGSLTREHVFPDWLSKLYPDEYIVNEITGGVQKKWPSKLFQHKAKVVCEKCNSGWMCQLEGDIKPLMIEMFSLKHRPLSKVDQDILALWAQKTVLMVNQASPGGLKVTQDVYDDIYATKAATKKVLVRIGWRMLSDGTKEQPLASFEIRQIPSITIPKGGEDILKVEMDRGGIIWKAVLAIGPIIFELIGHNMNLTLEAGSTTQVLTTIRPYANDFIWPTEWPIEAEGGLENLKGRE